MYNQCDCLTPHNQRPYPFQSSTIRAASRFSPHFVLSSCLPDLSLFSSLLSPYSPVCFPLSLSQKSSLLLSDYACSLSASWSICALGLLPLPGLITPITTQDENREKTRNGHGYIIRDRNNAHFPFFLTRSLRSRSFYLQECRGISTFLGDVFFRHL